MPKFNVRLDVRFNIEVEAEDEDAAREMAEDIFDPSSDPFEVTETLVFEA